MTPTKGGEGDFRVQNWHIFRSDERMNCVRSNKIKNYQSVGRFLSLQFMSIVKGKTDGKCQHESLPAGCVSRNPDFRLFFEINTTIMSRLFSNWGPEMTENHPKIAFSRFGRCDLAVSKNRFRLGSSIFEFQNTTWGGGVRNFYRQNLEYR